MRMGNLRGWEVPTFTSRLIRSYTCRSLVRLISWVRLPKKRLTLPLMNMIRLARRLISCVRSRTRGNPFWLMVPVLGRRWLVVLLEIPRSAGALLKMEGNFTGDRFVLVLYRYQEDLSLVNTNPSWSLRLFSRVRLARLGRITRVTLGLPLMVSP